MAWRVSFRGLALWLSIADGIGGWRLAAVVVTSSLVTGLGSVVEGPAMQAVTPRLVGREELPTAMALNSAPMTESDSMITILPTDSDEPWSTPPKAEDRCDGVCVSLRPRYPPVHWVRAHRSRSRRGSVHVYRTARSSSS